MQLRLEKSKRDLEVETKQGLAMRKKLEEELKDWKFQLERELEKAMKRLEEEDQVKQQLEAMNLTLTHEANEAKRQLKMMQSEYKAKLDVEMEDKRSLVEVNRKVQGEMEEVYRQLQQEERNRAEFVKQR